MCGVLGGVGALLLIGCNQIFGLEKTKLQQTDYYECDCHCSQNIAAPGAPVYAFPAQGFVQFAPVPGTGVVVDGPVDMPFNGSDAPWFQVHFDGGLVGWVQESFMSLSGVQPVFGKKPDVCLPPELNPYQGGTTEPSVDDLQALCAGPVAKSGTTLFESKLKLVAFCQCDAQSLGIDLSYDASCEAACPPGEEVCLRAGSDPPDPVPDPFSAAMFQPTSECDVAGDATLVVDGHEPIHQPQVRGVLQIQGRACPPGEGCFVGAAYVLESDDIEFDSDSIFADNPKFVDIGLLGATVPGVINLGPFLGGYLGEVPAGSAFTSAQGRPSDSPDMRVLTGTNTEGVALAVNWGAKQCRLSGGLVGQATAGDDSDAVDASVDIAIDGDIVNQPPQPDAGDDQTVECTSTAGALVTLDGSGTTDADGNIALYEWRVGSSTGEQVAPPSTSPTATVQQALGAATYHLFVVDTLTAADDDSVDVSVVDTTAPAISCNAPATITPNDVPEKGGLSFTASAEDTCTGVSGLRISSFSCTKPASCKVKTGGATLTILDPGGIGDVITWTVATADGSGNSGSATCSLTVVKK